MFSRRALLVVQFSIAILLISSVIIVDQQMKYVSNIDMGYEPEQLVAIPDIPLKAKEKYNVLKKELINQSGVMGVTTSLEVPSVNIADNCQVFTGGGWKNKNAPSFEVLPVDRDFISVMKMRLLAGNSLREYVPANLKPHQFKSSQDMKNYFETTKRDYVINQAGIKAMGWKTPQEAIGKQVGIHLNGINFKYGRVVGVVKNFHFTSLHTKIEPVIMFVEPIWYNNILIRIQAKDVENTLKKIKNVWGRVNPEYPFNYEFVNDAFAAKYLADNQFKLAISLFSTIAVIIACIGLFAVSLFSSKRRIKEIGIRKVLGASASGIVIMLTKDITKWILLANVVAWPVAYYGMTIWLQNFAYHINIHLLIFVAAGLLTFFVAVLTVSIQTIRAAMMDPVRSLRNE
jgi:putative ABC transport system permease protein